MVAWYIPVKKETECQTFSGAATIKKKSNKMKLRVKLCAEDLHRTYCRYFRTKLFNEVFLMALTSTEQLFIVRPLFPVTSVKTFLCNVIGFTIFIQKQSLEVFCLKRGLRNFAIFAGMLANSFLK